MNALTWWVGLSALVYAGMGLVHYLETRRPHPRPELWGGRVHCPGCGRADTAVMLGFERCDECWQAECAESMRIFEDEEG